MENTRRAPFTSASHGFEIHSGYWEQRLGEDVVAVGPDPGVTQGLDPASPSH